MEIKFFYLFTESILKICKSYISKKEKNLETLQTLIEHFEEPYKNWENNISRLIKKNLKKQNPPKHNKVSESPSKKYSHHKKDKFQNEPNKIKFLINGFYLLLYF